MNTTKYAIMTASKPIFTTLLFTSVPLYLQNITPIFASITAIIGTVYIFFKCWNEITTWRKNRNNNQTN